MNNQQLIKQIESKIINIKIFIQTQKQELNTYESTLQSLIQQLTEIKTKIKKKKK